MKINEFDCISTKQKVAEAVLQLEELIISGALRPYADIERKSVNCWEVNNCIQKRCPAYGKQDIKCWHEVGVFCKKKDSTKLKHSNNKDCRDCSVFKEATSTFDHRIKEGICNIFHFLACCNDEMLVVKTITNDAFNSFSNFYKLTPREGEVLMTYIEGLSRAQMSQSLCISEETIKFHAKKLYKKIGVSSRVELKDKLLEWQKNNNKDTNQKQS